MRNVLALTIVTLLIACRRGDENSSLDTTLVDLDRRATPMERAIPILPADDLRAAKEFYVDRLGFDVRFEATEDGKRGLLGVDRGTISLTLDSPMSGHGREACVSLQVESADAYYDEWRNRVEIRRPPQNEPWGARTFDVIDPFGNTIFVIGPVRQSARSSAPTDG